MFPRMIASFALLLAFVSSASAQAPSQVHLVQGVVHGIRSDVLGRALDADLRALEGVLVRVENFGSFRAYQQIARVLSSLPGVTRVDPRRFHIPARGDSSEDSVAQLLLATGASVETLGATLGRTPIPGLRLQVVPVHAGELRVVCVASDAVPSAAQPADASDASESEKLQ